MRFSSLLVVSLVAHVAIAAALWRNVRSARAAPPTPQPAPNGETYELPSEPVEEQPPEGTSPSDPTATATATATTTTTTTTTPTKTKTSTATATATSTTVKTSISSSASPAASAPPLFGAVGVRYAVDLFSTFTRALPQVSMDDKAWAALPIGPVGVADITIELDDTGHLAPTAIVFAGSPPAALRAASTRALAMVAGHAFTARGARSRLLVAAVISAPSNEDDFHGTRVALSGVAECDGFVCKPFFAQPGRRVDFTVKLLP
jgi:hypothetical protein